MSFKIILKIIQNLRKHGKTQKKLQQFTRTSKSKNRSELVRSHHPQEDVDTIRSMINKYGERSGGQLYEDNCFHVQSDEMKLEKDYHGDMVEREQDVHVKFGDMDKDFLTSYYRDEMKAKGIDADYDVRLSDNYDKRNPTYYNSESEVNKFLGYGSRNDVSQSVKCFLKMSGNNDFKLWVIGSDYCSSRRFKTDHE